jgi:Cdc6-like AAA superfamily ATPase
MSLDKLLEKAKEYNLSQEIIDLKESGRFEFVSKFPIDQIGKLQIDEYVAGTDKNSFSYWLEFKKILFGIGGGNASKFGLYKGADGNYYGGTGQNKILLKGKELEKQFEIIKTGIIKALDYAENNRISEIKTLNIPIWNMVLQKILTLYYPDKFITIGASDVLIECAKDISLDGIELIPENLIEINYECKKKLDTQAFFKNWSYVKIGSLIWETYYDESKRDYFILGSKYGENNNVDIFPDMLAKSVISVGFASKYDLTEYFQAKPVDIAEFLEKKGEKQKSINALKHFLSLKVGDRIAIKASGSPKGTKGFLSIVGIAEVIEKDGKIYEHDPKGLGHIINVTYLNAPVYKEFEVGGYGSTIHKLTKRDQIDLIFKGKYTIAPISGNDFNSILTKFEKSDLDFYFNFLRTLIKYFDLHSGDERLVFSIRDNNLNFMIGQRYCWNIYISNSDGRFGIISKAKINSRSKRFEGSGQQPFYTHVSETDFNEKNLTSVNNSIEVELKRTKKSGFRKFNNIDFENYAFGIIPLLTNNNKMELSLNTILFGPPGTGKTYLLKNKYMHLFTSSENSITRDEFLKDVIQNCSWWQVIALAVLELGKTKVSGVFNHEFVKIKAQLSNSTTVTPTIWGQLQSHTIEECEHVKVQRRMPPFIFNKTDNSEWEILLKEVKEQAPEILELKMKIEDFANIPNKKIERFEFLTFHQSYSYEDFIEGIKPELSESDVAYKIEEGVFQKMCNRARNDSANNYAIFIDEINRGNISSIFGELITLIEDDKREGKPNQIKATLPYSKNLFSVPNNLYIIGTMNTADRSVEALDTALRRRFSFIEMNPEPETLNQSEFKCDGIDLTKLLIAINGRIEKLLDKDYCIGHSYFMTIKNKKSPLEELNDIFKNKILPLLQEYFYGDWGKIMLVVGKDFVFKKVEPIKFLSNDLADDYEEYNEKPIYCFTQSANWTLDSFKSIYE